MYFLPLFYVPLFINIIISPPQRYMDHFSRVSHFLFPLFIIITLYFTLLYYAFSLFITDRSEKNVLFLKFFFLVITFFINFFIDFMFSFFCYHQLYYFQHHHPLSITFVFASIFRSFSYVPHRYVLILFLHYLFYDVSYSSFLISSFFLSPPLSSSSFLILLFPSLFIFLPHPLLLLPLPSSSSFLTLSSLFLLPLFLPPPPLSRTLFLPLSPHPSLHPSLPSPTTHI